MPALRWAAVILNELETAQLMRVQDARIEDLRAFTNDVLQTMKDLAGNLADTVADLEKASRVQNIRMGLLQDRIEKLEAGQ